MLAGAEATAPASAILPRAPCARAHRAGPPTCKIHTGGNPTLTPAKRQQTALAACRVTLAGAAEMGAWGGHPPFDPINLLKDRLLGDVETGGSVTSTNPVHL